MDPTKSLDCKTRDRNKNHEGARGESEENHEASGPGSEDRTRTGQTAYRAGQIPGNTAESELDPRTVSAVGLRELRLLTKAVEKREHRKRRVTALFLLLHHPAY